MKPGVVYLGHLPYGFVEDGIKQFFDQFGQVTKVKLMRSKKTARSKGYGFIEFGDEEVAKIAAEAMNGYMMYGTPLVARKLLETEIHDNLFIRSNKKFKYVPWHLIYRTNLNRERTPEQARTTLLQLIEADAKRENSLKEAGFKLNYKGFSSLLPKGTLSK